MVRVKLPKESKKGMHRINTRVPIEIDLFVKSEVKKSNGTLTEGVVYRILLEEAINNRKK